MSRHEVREQIFMFLFESTFGNDSIDDIIESAQMSREIKSYGPCRRIFNNIHEKKEQIDKYIDENSKNWNKNRMSRVALCLLRLSIYEIIYEGNIPTSVSINEAVELAKKYGTEQDASFINGVLGAAEKQIGKDSSCKDIKSTV